MCTPQTREEILREAVTTRELIQKHQAPTTSIITDTISGKGVDLDSEDLIRRADKNAEARVMDALRTFSLPGNQ